MNPLDLVKSICSKTKTDIDKIDVGICLTLNKWLAFNKSYVGIIRDLLQYTFYIQPQHYYYLLYLHIPASYGIPKFIKKPAEEKEDKFYERFKYIMNWSSREFALNYRIFEQTILPERKQWEKQLGV